MPGMTRLVSFWVLVAVIILLGALFYRVMVGFLLPLFLALLLVVIFKPIHVWMLQKTKGRARLSALLTTASVLLAVLVPSGIITALAALEGRELVRQMDTSTLRLKLDQFRSRVGLDSPKAAVLRQITTLFDDLMNRSALVGMDTVPDDSWVVSVEEIQRRVHEVATQAGLAWPEADAEPDSLDGSYAQRELNALVRQARDLMDLVRPETWENVEAADRPARWSDVRDRLADFLTQFHRFENALLGGRFRAWLKQLANPDKEVLSKYTEQVVTYARTHLVSLTGATAAWLGRVAINIVIMIVSMYFFLVDGPKMLAAVQSMSPLDDRHERELLAEFDRVSRAVVLATLLSALAQGTLAGIGYFFAGLESVFLLMLVTMVLALVPFVGAAAVWIPCCLFLYFYEGRTVAAIGLALWGVLAVSMIDNIIKPMVLHGQSNLHPLLALLSVLGGVSALGPIGILIGPMIVAFLQTLLNILRRELTAMDTTSTPSPPVPPPPAASAPTGG